MQINKHTGKNAVRAIDAAHAGKAKRTSTNYHKQMEDNNTIIHSTLDEGYDFFITDKWGNEKHFKISTFEVPSGLLSEAFEVIKSNFDDEPRVFHVLSNFNSDIEKAETQLKKKIKKGINKRYLDNKGGAISMLDGLEVAGRILCDENLDNSSFDYLFHIDGKRITIEEFIGLLKGAEGWNFRFQIIHTTDDID